MPSPAPVPVAVTAPPPSAELLFAKDCVAGVEISDPKGSLSHVLARLHELADRRATDHVRMAMYGDSNLTMDQFTGRLRRALQGSLGDGGHGWVSLSRPWGWYQHEDVHHSGTWHLFREIATSTNQIKDAHYGLANMAAEGYLPGANAWVATSASRFELYYLKQPTGGQLDIQIDGAPVKSLSTRNPEYEAAIEHFDVPEGDHELRAITGGHGAVRLFGVTMEHDTPGIVIDSLGAGALNFEQMAHVRTVTRRPMVERRAWDLVIFQLGTNMFAPKMHKEWAKQVLAEYRDTLPGASLLLMSPADTVESWNSAHSDPRIVTISRQLREVAEELGIAFWDYREAMGGDASMRTFMHKDLAEPDRVHLKKEGAYLMADRFLCALQSASAR